MCTPRSLSRRATTALLTPEQCGFGGRFFGRAFDPSQLLGDSCYMGTVEFRFDLPQYWQPVTQTTNFAGKTYSLRHIGH